MRQTSPRRERERKKKKVQNWGKELIPETRTHRSPSIRNVTRRERADTGEVRKGFEAEGAAQASVAKVNEP